jgi:hypothetical protein
LEADRKVGGESIRKGQEEKGAIFQNLEKKKMICF